MKILYRRTVWVFIAITLYIIPSIADAQCNVNVTLSSQAAVDSFPLTHNCTEFTGVLTISGSDITNLDSLYRLKSIGRLFIQSNPNLSSLRGLSGLRHVGNGTTFPPFALSVSGNPLLVDLTGLGSLQEITNGGLGINGNNALTSFEGLDSLQTIGGTIQTMGNAALVSFRGLKSLKSIGLFSNVCWVIANNNSLPDLNGFPLKTLPGRFIINNNASFRNFAGLDSLTWINGSLYVVGNPALVNFNGLGSLARLGGPNALDAALLVSSNHALQNFEGLSSLKSISGAAPGTGLIISDNSLLQNISALSSLDTLNGYLQVLSNPQLTTLVGLGNIKHVEGLEIRDNDALTRLTDLSGLTSIGIGFSRESLVVSGNRLLKNLKGLESVTTLPGGVLISENDSLKNLAGLESVTSMGGTPYPCCLEDFTGTVKILSNPLLKDVDALSSLTTVYHGLYINDNPSLKNLDGLSSLTAIKVIGDNPPAQLRIMNNTALKNVNGLSSLTVMEGNKASVVVSGNTSLMECCGLYPLLSNGLGCDSRPSCASVTISGNGAGCTQQDILASGACGASMTFAEPTVYPNPSSDAVYFEVTDDFIGGYSLAVYDLTNQLVQEQAVKKDARVLKAAIDVASMKKGMYILKVTRSDGEIFQERLAVRE